MSKDSQVKNANPVPLADDPEAGSTWVISLAGITILSILVIATCVFYFKFETKEVDIKVIEPANTWSLGLKTQQLGELAVYQKYSVTAPDGTAESRIRIPISNAMDLVVAEAKNPPKAVASASAATTTATSTTSTTINPSAPGTATK